MDGAKGRLYRLAGKAYHRYEGCQPWLAVVLNPYPCPRNQAYLAKAREQNKYQEALQWLRIGRVSWKLRDDDNILLGKLENHLLVFMQAGAAALAREGKLARVPKKINPALKIPLMNYTN